MSARRGARDPEIRAFVEGQLRALWSLERGYEPGAFQAVHKAVVAQFGPIRAGALRTLRRFAREFEEDIRHEQQIAPHQQLVERIEDTQRQAAEFAERLELEGSAPSIDEMLKQIEHLKRREVPAALPDTPQEPV